MKEGQQQRREWYGNVVSNKMNKTVVAVVQRSVIHPVYKKVLRRVTKLKAHDEGNVCKVGDRVQLSETTAHQQRQALACGTRHGQRAT